ncbi:PfkB family carbohydrate kinase [Paenibacillus sp. GCM10027628]|uniref:PfkB family carbohydrate kinase n=1 Tax=Paenibacillus sp. GCM10027628 TaxID=3273413 RepID=UPI00363C21D6
MKYDVVTLGEYLIDFTPYGTSAAGQPLFERNPGGAPVNVAVAAAKLGKKTAFIGKVGMDPFGVYLRQALLEQGVSGAGLVASDEAHTTLAFVQLDERGERSFHFARKPGADQLLREDELNTELLSGTKIFHFGSISMTAEPSAQATIKAVQFAKENGALISYDPNWRPLLWESEWRALEAIHIGLGFADIVKVSEEELVFLTGEPDMEAASMQLMEQNQLQLLLVTAGSKGSFYRMNGIWGQVGSCSVASVDTTGAGDGFLGAFLFRVLEQEKPLQAWSESELREALFFANAAGALATTRKGAIPALGSLDEIETLVAANKASMNFK